MPQPHPTEAPPLRASQNSPYTPLHLAAHLYLLTYVFNKLVNIGISLNSVGGKDIVCGTVPLACGL